MTLFCVGQTKAQTFYCSEMCLKAKGHVRGQSVLPLYYTVPQAIDVDKQLYEMLALIDALRVGRAREKNLALEMLRMRILL